MHDEVGIVPLRGLELLKKQHKNIKSTCLNFKMRLNRERRSYHRRGESGIGRIQQTLYMSSNRVHQTHNHLFTLSNEPV